jgi:CcmD family protein
VSGGDYLAAAYLVVFAVVLVYVLIIALKLARLDRDLAELAEILARRARISDKETEVGTEATPSSFGRAFARRGKGRVG